MDPQSSATRDTMASSSVPSEDPATTARFNLELEFVCSLANPAYLNHLAAQKHFESAEFVAYLDYLQYWSRPEYAQFLLYPGPTLKVLELLQQERFRKAILMPDEVSRLAETWIADTKAA